MTVLLLCLNLVLAVFGVAWDMPFLALMNGFVSGALALGLLAEIRERKAR